MLGGKSYGFFEYLQVVSSTMALVTMAPVTMALVTMATGASSTCRLVAVVGIAMAVVGSR